MNQAEIVIYRTSDNPDFQIEVRIEDETVWLTQTQLAELFEATKQNISLHISNIFREGELEPQSTVKEYLTVQMEGNRKVRRKLSFYNLDVIISVGYRVKSHQGTQFRIWANKVLKEYLLKGYAISHRLDKVERKLIEHDQKFELLINTNLPQKEGIFYDGQIFDAWEFVCGLIKEATRSIVLIDNYIDESVLSLLAKRQPGVGAEIYTSRIEQVLSNDLKRHNAQYPAIELKIFDKSHDRFLIIDQKTVYHIGASLKDLGKKWFAFSRINLDAEELIRKLSDV
ncbi:MAG TPA: RhuM family protein [Bacteroidales bacterium]|nr:RhuM family protein [Bacteroidales bacterium]HRZ50304.1 RhuM family protein [Bacteroidales bacterium]